MKMDGAWRGPPTAGLGVNVGDLVLHLPIAAILSG